MFSEADVTLISTQDEVAPAKGTITASGQLDNETLFVEGTNPGADSNGAKLSGLTGRYQIYAPVVNGNNPFTITNPDGSTSVKSSPEIVQMSVDGSAQAFLSHLDQEADKGQPYRDEFPISSVGPTYAVATIFTDDVVVA